MHKHTTIPSLRPLRALATGACALLAGVTAASAATHKPITEATGLFAPDFRGNANTTYFAWTYGNWDGNVDTPPPNVDVINGTPNIGSGFGTLLTQATPADIVSGSNNIYSDVPAINSVGLSLSIPTSGNVGTGFTTIVIQGTGLNGSMFGLDSGIDTFGFATINGIAPTYIFNDNALIATQFWAKWELPGNAASYTVNIVGFDINTTPGDDFVFPISVTDLSVDTLWSESGYSPDTALVPEPSSGLMLLSGTALLGMLRRRRSITA
jgi:hypothetical protein